MHLNTDNYYEKMADDYYNSESFEPNTDDEQVIYQCPECEEAFDKSEESLCDGVCPECEENLIEK